MTNKNKQSLKKKNSSTPHSAQGGVAQNYADATGKVDYCLTNDYMFRAVFQSNKKALNGLLCAILHLAPEQIRSTRIMNPIELGEAFDEKTFILDISILLNDDSYVNLEMQVAKLDYWQERSLAYLCRTFDHLSRGEDYIKTKETIQVSFLDFTLFPEHPEFFATYKMLNVKNHHLYSDKFTLSVIDLSQITLATKEDKANGIDAWAALFKATEWEEIKMLAHGNKFMEEAVYAMYRLSKNSKIRQQCEAREDYMRRRSGVAERVRMMIKEVKDGRAEVEAGRAEVEAGKAEVDARKAEVDAGRAQV